MSTYMIALIVTAITVFSFIVGYTVARYRVNMPLELEVTDLQIALHWETRKVNALHAKLMCAYSRIDDLENRYLPRQAVRLEALREDTQWLPTVPVALTGTTWFHVLSEGDLQRESSDTGVEPTASSFIQDGKMPVVLPVPFTRTITWPRIPAR